MKRHEATQIWQMLDKLSSTDPVAYRNFIKEQMEEGKLYTEPPKPQLLIKLRTNLHTVTPVCILFCSWSRIPSSDDTSKPINIINGDVYQCSSQDEIMKIYPLAFCDKIATKLSNPNDLDAQDLELIDMAIDHVNQKIGNVGSKMIYEFCDYKDVSGDLKLIYEAFKFQEYNPEEELKRVFDGNNEEKVDLFKEIKENKAADNCLTELKISPNNDNNNSGVKQRGKQVLIEEINKEKPPYLIEENKSGTQVTVKIRINVETINSVNDLELDVSEKSLHVEIPKHKSFQPITVNFPKPVSLSTVSCKYRKKSQLLFVSGIYR